MSCVCLCAFSVSFFLFCLFVCLSVCHISCVKGSLEFVRGRVCEGF